MTKYKKILVLCYTCKKTGVEHCRKIMMIMPNKFHHHNTWGLCSPVKKVQRPERPYNNNSLLAINYESLPDAFYKG